jgi:membrane associated rhomboid family serine protease
MRQSDDEKWKKRIVSGIVVPSVGVFAINRLVGSSTRIPFKIVMAWSGFVSKHLSYKKENRFYTVLTYPFNHRTLGHLVLNGSLLYVLGSELAQARDLSANQVGGLTVTGAAAAAIAEAPFLGYGMSVIGASGVVMGYLGFLGLSAPQKEWKMVFPIPGLTLTTLQLFQVVTAGHILALLMIGPGVVTRIALRGHLASLVAGSGMAFLADKYAHNYDFVCNTKSQWRRTFSGTH